MADNRSNSTTAESIRSKDRFPFIKHRWLFRSEKYRRSIRSMEPFFITRVSSRPQLFRRWASRTASMSAVSLSSGSSLRTKQVVPPIDPQDSGSFAWTCNKARSSLGKIDAPKSLNTATTVWGCPSLSSQILPRTSSPAKTSRANCSETATVCDSRSPSGFPDTHRTGNISRKSGLTTTISLL